MGSMPRSKTPGPGKPEGTMRRLAETFKALGDLTRVRIVHLLAKKEFCVGDIALILGITQSCASHQLGHLRAMDLVKVHREGKNILYALDDEHIEHLIEEGFKHVEE